MTDSWTQSRQAGRPDAEPREDLRLRSLLLLAGGVRTNSIASQLGRSVLDLPIDGSTRLLDVWMARFRAFRKGFPQGRASADLHVLAGPSSPLPSRAISAEGPRLRAERDQSAYRGTAGVLRDICEAMDDEDYVLVGTASQCPDEGVMRGLVLGMDSSAGVTLSAGRDGAPTGLMLLRCEALRGIPPAGYIDFKEQALPQIAQESGVCVVRTLGPIAPPMHSLKAYIQGVRSWQQSGGLNSAACAQPFAEQWRSAFAIVEGGAKVADSARLHDAVVLAGGEVQAGAVVVRSVVGPGGLVRRGQQIIDKLVVGSIADSPAGVGVDA